MILTVANLLIDADAIAAWHGFDSNDRLMRATGSPRQRNRGHAGDTAVLQAAWYWNRKFSTDSFGGGSTRKASRP